MYSGQHRSTKNSANSSDKPAPSRFAPRGFVVQPKTEEVAPQQEQTPESETQKEETTQDQGGLIDFSKLRPRPSPARTPRLQMKLTIGQPGDKYEQEADRMAADVVQRINAPQSESVQRQETPKQEELLQEPLAGNLQRQETPEEEELQRSSIVQRLSVDGGMDATPDIEESIQGAKGGGQPLAENVRQPMEQAFGADFSGVKVHTDTQSDQINQSIQAKAFTTGQDVFFRQGEYNPGSRGGQELLAHELTHVVQQNGGAVQRSLQPPEQLQQPPSVSGMAAEVIQRKGFALPSARLPDFKDTDTAAYQKAVDAVKNYIAAPESGDPRKDFEEVEEIAKLIDESGVDRVKPGDSVKPSEMTPGNVMYELYYMISKEMAAINSEKDALKLAFEQRGGKIEDDNFDKVLDLSKDGKYREVLAAYDNNWFTAKEHLAYIKYAKDSKEYAQRMGVMKQLLTYRKEETRKFLEPVMVETAQAILEKSGGGEAKFEEIGGDKGYKMVAGGKDLISAFAPGSQTLTSDIDITFNAPGNEDYEIDLVKRFNIDFRNQWGLSSGIVFDVNAYTSGFMSKASGHLPPEDDQKPLKDLLGEDDKKNVKGTKHLTQMALGFLPIRKYFAEDTTNWELFKIDTWLKLNTCLKEKNIPVKARLEAAADVEAIHHKTEQLYAETEEALLQKQQDISGKRAKSGQKELSSQHLNALAGDQLYEDQLDKIRRLLMERQLLVKHIPWWLEKSNLEGLNNEESNKRKTHLQGLQTELANNMNEFEVEQGKALVYANEAYYTAGAAIHVVKGMQGGGAVTLGRQQQMSSVLMNIGYKLMHYKHNHHEGGEGRALVATSKYGERIRDLVKQGQGKKEGGRGATYKPNVDPKLHELLANDLGILDNEKNLIDNYKKTKTLNSPAAREAKAQQDLGKAMSPKEMEAAYLRIAESVLGPFYLDKYSEKKKLWASDKGE